MAKKTEKFHAIMRGMTYLQVLHIRNFIPPGKALWLGTSVLCETSAGEPGYVKWVSKAKLAKLAKSGQPVPKYAYSKEEWDKLKWECLPSGIDWEET